MAKNAKKRRERLFKENPNCPQCSILMMLPSEGITFGPNLAVLYHTVGKLDTEGIPKTILCCHNCSSKMNDQREKGRGIDVLRKLSSHSRCVCSTCGFDHVPLNVRDADKLRNELLAHPHPTK